MVKSVEDCKKYGVPLYGALWVPPAAFTTADSSKKDGDGNGDDNPSESASVSSPPSNYVVLAGGGGEGRSGIPNAIVLSKFDSDSKFLSDTPVAKLGTGADLPYRIAVHPGGDGLICSLPQSCRWYEWDAERNNNAYSLTLRSSERVLTNLEDIGQQLALIFNDDGSLLASGGEDGKLRVLRWPSMELILDEANAHASVKDLDFSPDGKLLVSVGSGPARVWDLEKSTAIASLQKGNDEVFGFCKFSRTTDVLYITAMQGGGGSILTWNTTTWKKMSSKRIARDPVSAFNVSFDGKFSAIGTIQGDVIILRNSTNTMLVQNLVKKAHLGLVTALRFSHDSSCLLSASLDSSARVTTINEEKSVGFLPLRLILLMILLAIALYYGKINGLLPNELGVPFKL